MSHYRFLKVMSFLAIGLTAANPEPAGNDLTPRLIGVLPPSAIPGDHVVWALTGQNLGRIDRIAIEGTGVTGRITRASQTSALAEVTAEPLAREGFRAIRIEGPDGISNLAMIRVDHLRSVVEHEPNDTPAQATPLPLGSAAVGTLTPQDRDDYRVEGRQGGWLTIEVEARRLGLAMAPVLTVMRPDGRALAQGRETPGLDGDGRLVVRFPADGSYIIQLRDNLFGGSDGACYRLRVTGSEPYATAFFPLGGPAGRPLTVRASGGNLLEPVVQTLVLPDRPGTVVNVPPFPNRDGVFLAPARLVAGDGPEVDEPDALLEVSPTGITINGRLEQPGEVDRHRVRVKEDAKVRVQVIAAALGSWLDSVLTVRDAAGRIVAANDDAEAPDRTDSLVAFQAGPDQELTIEVADRYDRGGQEYAYRLLIGKDEADFQVSARWLGPLPETGASTLKAGSSISLLCEIRAEGRTGPIVLTAQGLPRGVTASPVTVRPRGATAQTSVVLRADPNSQGVSGQIRVVARATPRPGRIVEHLAGALLRIDHAGSNETSPRPVFREVTEFPIRVVAP